VVVVLLSSRPSFSVNFAIAEVLPEQFAVLDTDTRSLVDAIHTERGFPAQPVRLCRPETGRRFADAPGRLIPRALLGRDPWRIAIEAACLQQIKLPRLIRHPMDGCADGSAAFRGRVQQLEKRRQLHFLRERRPHAVS
jgi:hypothetical protein